MSTKSLEPNQQTTAKPQSAKEPKTENKKEAKAKTETKTGTGTGTQPEPQNVPQKANSHNSEDNLVAMLCHIGTFFGLIIPTSNVVIPLIIMITKQKESPFIADHAKESLNFQISMFIYTIVGIILSFVFIGLFILIGLGIFELVAIILASIAAHKGEKFRYPLSIHFVK